MSLVLIKEDAPGFSLPYTKYDDPDICSSTQVEKKWRILTNANGKPLKPMALGPVALMGLQHVN